MLLKAPACGTASSVSLQWYRRHQPQRKTGSGTEQAGLRQSQDPCSGAGRTPGKSSDLHAPALEHPPAGAKVPLGAPSLARVQVSAQRPGPGRQRPFPQRFRPRWCFPVVQVCGVSGLKPKTPLSQGGPGPTTSRPPCPAALSAIQQRGGGGGRAGEGSWTDQVPQSLLPTPQPASLLDTWEGNEKSNTPPSPPTPRPRPLHPRDPAPPPRAQLTSRGRSHDEGQCQESYAELGGAHGGAGQRGDPRTSPSRPVPPQCARCWAGAGGSAGSARSPGDAQLQPGLRSYIFITRAEFLTPRLLGGSGESPAPGQPLAAGGSLPAVTGTGGERGLAEPTGAALPPRSPPGTVPLSIPKLEVGSIPAVPSPPPHSVWDYRWTSGACQEAERAGDSSSGPSPPHSLQTQAVGHTLPPALGTPQPAVGPASPMSERGGSHLMRGRWCHGDPQTKPNSCLQAQAPLWAKPSEHLLEAPSSGPRQPWQPRYRWP